MEGRMSFAKAMPADSSLTADTQTGIPRSESLVGDNTPEGSNSLQLYIDESGRGNVYEAALAFFDYLQGPSQEAIELSAAGDQLTVSDRAAAMGKTASSLAAVRAYCDARGQGSLSSRLPVGVEAVALGLCRHLCVQHQYEAAHGLIKALSMVAHRSIHLRAVEHAVGLLLKQAPVPAALQKFVGANANALQDRFCPIPFARADVHQAGEVLMCCAHWLPTALGNVFQDTTNDILNSDTARAIRRSVVDGSFKYCSHADCEWMVNDKLPRKVDYVGKDYVDNDYHVPAAVLENAFSGISFDIDNVSFMTFCLDRTCNLTCPSCRADLIMIKGAERDRLYEATERAVLPMLRGAKRALINSAGEAFVSRPSRRLMEGLAEPGYESVVVDIITNGTVCTKEEWDKFSHLYGRIHFVRVSMDAATKETFEKLRRGAHFETVVNNLRNIYQMVRDGRVFNFTMSFTYQRDNVHEMQRFVEFGKEIGAQALIFEKLHMMEGAYSPHEFHERAVHLVDHPLHQEFLRQARAVKKDEKVYIDCNP